MEPLDSPATRPPNEAGHLLSFVLIGVLAALLFAVDMSDLEPGSAKPGRGMILLGLYIMAWGFMFLASYYFDHKSFFCEP